MRSARWVGVLLALLLVACDGGGDADAGMDGGTPDGDGGGSDGGGSDGGGDEDPGSLVTVSVDSTVGVLLEDFPAGSRDRVATALSAEDDAFWEERVRRQLRLTGLRLTYRAFFYDEEKASLPLPPEEVWDIAFAGPAERRTIDGHELLVRDYTVTSTLLSDVESPAISEPALAAVGGAWDEEFVFPVDPTLLLQRTGFACMDEDQFPPESVDEENAYEFFDDTCEVEVPAEQACHYTELPTESCIEALERAVGSVATSLRYERIAWDETIADAVRTGTVTTPDAPDLRVVTEGFQSLSNNRVVYRYIPDGDCAVVEGCVGGTGWRRLLAFDSIDHNTGGEALHIGEVDYAVEGLGGELIDHNVYVLSACHEHYHFEHYGDFSFSAPGTSTLAKNGFCLESTGRLSNNESSWLYTEHDCHNQGVDPGWVDLYAAGLVCNWLDVTDVDTSGGPVTGTLEFASNPDDFMCEGTLVTDASGAQVWESTSFTTEAGDPVDRPACEPSVGTDANDVGRVSVTLPVQGGMMSSPCVDEQALGPQRNCGFTASSVETCTPGATVELDCTGASAAAPQAVRVCEASRALGGGVDCFFRDALASAVAEDGTTTLSFTCPSMRDATETGGQFAVYSAPALSTDGPLAVTCVAR